MGKRIFFLGAAPTQIPPLRYAREQGCCVIICDFLPDNAGHILADEWHNVSTTDKDAAVELAKRLGSNAIAAYASDLASPTAAYGAEQLGLPGNPYQAVLSLARKELFRALLKQHGFNVQRSLSFRDREAARAWLLELGPPVFVKPVDSSGSKGLTRVAEVEKFDKAFDHALALSREKMVIVEAEIVRSTKLPVTALLSMAERPFGGGRTSTSTNCMTGWCRLARPSRPRTRNLGLPWRTPRARGH